MAKSSTKAEGTPQSQHRNNAVLGDVEVCGTLFGRRDFVDVSGCLKPSCHNDFHVCRTADGRLMAWHDDEECTCGCWDEDDFSSVCRVYWEVANIA